MSANNSSVKEMPKFIKKITWKKDFKRNKVVYLLFLPVLAYFIIFNYVPMVGISMAFQNYKMVDGIFGSAWIGMDNFVRLFSGTEFGLVIRNTLVMALLNLTLGYIAPVILALLLSQMRIKWFKKAAQTISYFPFFVAVVVVVQLVKEFLGDDGALTALLSVFGLEKQNWVANSEIPSFWLINTFTEIWQGCGYGSIIFVAAIANIDGDLHEAAAIDGANRFTRVLRITLPCMLPMLVMMFTMKIGTVFMTGFDKILLLYSPSTYNVADCVSTYTYRMSFGGGVPDYAISAASGLFQSVVSTALLLSSNYLSRKITKTSIF